MCKARFEEEQISIDEFQMGREEDCLPSGSPNNMIIFFIYIVLG